MSSIATPGTPAPRGVASTLAEEADEGVRLCEFVIRMRTKNRILVGTLTEVLTAEHVARWRRFVREDARRLARESRENAQRAARLRDATAGSDGVGRSAHDYRGLDAGHLDRRARVAKLVSRRLLAAARSTAFLADVVRTAGAAAAEEILAGAAERMTVEDRALLDSRVDAMRDLIAQDVARRPRLRR